MAEFKKLSDVSVIESMKDGLSVLIEDNGEIVKLAADSMIPKDVALKSDIPTGIVKSINNEIPDEAGNINVDSLPAGGSSNQQLVIDSEGNVKWEDSQILFDYSTCNLFIEKELSPEEEYSSELISALPTMNKGVLVIDDVGYPFEYGTGGGGHHGFFLNYLSLSPTFINLGLHPENITIINEDREESHNIKVFLGNELIIKKIPVACLPSQVGYIMRGMASSAEIFNDMTNNVASNYYSHAEGSYATASGYSSHAEGSYATASGDFSHAEGEGTEASNSGSHAEGGYTTASGQYSHSEGHGTEASGDFSHTEGRNTTASGHYSHAEGISTIASGNEQHVQGRYNIEDNENQYAHIVGNGEQDHQRSNAHTLDWFGNAWFAGTVEGTGIIVKSSTADSTKRFIITVDDAGTISAAEINV